MRKLLSEIDRGNLSLAWEPRGDWTNQPERVEKICRDLDLIHVADPLRDGYRPYQNEIAYVRLHGLNEDPYGYDNDYSKDELKKLTDQLSELASDHKRVYCLLNNYAMYDNAHTLEEILEA